MSVDKHSKSLFWSPRLPFLTGLFKFSDSDLQSHRSFICPLLVSLYYLFAIQSQACLLSSLPGRCRESVLRLVTASPGNANTSASITLSFNKEATSHSSEKNSSV